MVFNFDTPEKEAAPVIGVAPETLKKDRLSGKIPSYIYTKTGYKTIRYCLVLLRDWQQDPNDIEAQSRAQEQLQASRVSNLPRKQGRKAA